MKQREKTEMVMVRMSKQEKEKIVSLAKENALTLSDYIRFVALNTKIQTMTSEK